MKRLAIALIAAVAVLLVGCGSSDTEQGFAGTWVSTGGSELRLYVVSTADGAYDVTFTSGDVERTMTAVADGEAKYRAEQETDTWVFRMPGDDLLNVTIIPQEGESASTTFKRTEAD